LPHNGCSYAEPASGLIWPRDFVRLQLRFARRAALLGGLWSRAGRRFRVEWREPPPGI